MLEASDLRRLDRSGLRVSRIDKLLVRGYDELRHRVRVPEQITKMRRFDYSRGH